MLFVIRVDDRRDLYSLVPNSNTTIIDATQRSFFLFIIFLLAFRRNMHSTHYLNKQSNMISDLL